MAMRALIGQHDHFAALFEHQRSKFRSASRKKNGGENCCRFHNSLPVVIFSSRLNILMLFSFVGLFYYWVPTEMLKEYPTLNTILFQSALIGLIPFAERLGFVTEQLAMHTNDTYGGLLNATFGNASELIFCCFALRNRLYRVVQLSLLGSILSNLLFVLGLSCFVGGLKYQVQTFTKVSGAVSSGMLMLASISLVLPAALKFSGQEDDATDEIYFSRFTAIIMLIMYFAYLLFQLRTHVGEFENADHSNNHSSDDEEQLLSQASNHLDDDDNDDTNVPSVDTTHTQLLSFGDSVAWLFIFTGFTSFLSDIIVGTMDEFTTKHNVSAVFVAAVVLPLFSNAAEHTASVVFAYRNKMDICLGIAIGSSIQIALCVIPFCVIIGWITNRDLSLFFDGFETASLLVSVVTVCFILQGGSTNWLVGVLLLGAYSVICMGFWVHRLEIL
tara:strand:- start:632 stop:1963 length:1332 start_codon:yes stop_codon:yes gene_type:complete